MTDIFDEIDEDLRRERLSRLWNRFGIYVILFVVAVIAGTAAYSGWRWWQQREAQATSVRFEAAVKLADEGKHQEAEAAFKRSPRMRPLVIARLPASAPRPNLPPATRPPPSPPSIRWPPTPASPPPSGIWRASAPP